MDSGSGNIGAAEGTRRPIDGARHVADPLRHQPLAARGHWSGGADGTQAVLPRNAARVYDSTPLSIAGRGAIAKTYAPCDDAGGQFHSVYAGSGGLGSCPTCAAAPSLGCFSSGCAGSVSVADCGRGLSLLRILAHRSDNRGYYFGEVGSMSLTAFCRRFVGCWREKVSGGG